MSRRRRQPKKSENKSAAGSKHVTEQPVDFDTLFKQKLEEQAQELVAMKEARAEEADSENEDEELPAAECRRKTRWQRISRLHTFDLSVFTSLLTQGK